MRQLMGEQVPTPGCLRCVEAGDEVEVRARGERERSVLQRLRSQVDADVGEVRAKEALQAAPHRVDRKSTRLNSSHANISYAVFCLKKKKKKNRDDKPRKNKINNNTN